MHRPPTRIQTEGINLPPKRARKIRPAATTIATERPAAVGTFAIATGLAVGTAGLQPTQHG